MSIKLLAIDTTTEACSVALSTGTEITEKFCIAPQKHTQIVLPMINELLATAALKIGGLDAIAVTRGPGSFTGVRIGIGIAQGLAFSADLPVVPISTLNVVAHNAVRNYNASHILVGLDARMSEIYYASFRTQDEELINETPECVIAADKIVFPLNFSGIIIGTAWKTNVDLFQNKQIRTEQIIHDTYPRAADLLCLALKSFSRHGGVAPELLSPVYLRDKVTQE